MSCHSSGITHPDRRLLRLGIALPRGGDQARVDDLARHRKIAAFLQPRIEDHKQLSDRASFGQQVPKRLDRLRIRRLVRQTHGEEPHE